MVCGLSGCRLRHWPTLGIWYFIGVIIIYLFQVYVGVLNGGVNGGPVGDGRPSTVGHIIGDIGRALFGLLTALLRAGSLSLLCTSEAITVTAEVPLMTVIALNVLSRFLSLFTLAFMVQGLECGVLVS